MEIEVFAEKICREMRREFGNEVRVETIGVRKNNGVILHGLMARRQGWNVAPTVYLDTFLEAYEAGAAFGPIVGRVRDIFRENLEKRPADMGFFRSFEQVRDRICYRLVGRKGNEGMLAGVPYIDFLDLAICFYYSYNGEMGEGTIQIDKSHMEMWDTCIAELFSLSKRNTPRLFPWECGGLREVLEEMAAQDGGYEDLESLPEELCREVPMMVLGNTRKSNGAACILYPGVLEEMVRRIGGSFYILPSSVHEVILLPDTGMESGVEELKELIKDVNSTHVAPEDVLSDTLYRYDSSQGRVVMV